MNNPKFDASPTAPDVIEHAGRFYINMGRPGFNSRTNNRNGYATRQLAQDVIDGKRSRTV